MNLLGDVKPIILLASGPSDWPRCKGHVTNEYNSIWLGPVNNYSTSVTGQNQFLWYSHLNWAGVHRVQ